MAKIISDCLIQNSIGQPSSTDQSKVEFIMHNDCIAINIIKSDTCVVVGFELLDKIYQMRKQIETIKDGD